MLQFRRYIISGILAAVMTMGTAFPTLAAKKPELRTPITSISIDVRSNVEAETDYDEATVMVTTNHDLYTVGAYTWVSKNEYWKIGDVPKIKVELHAKTGYYFKVTGASKYQITGAEYSSAKKDKNNETIYLTLKLNPASGQLEEPDNAEWEGYPVGKAVWDEVESAGAYELKLFKNDQIIYSVEKVNTTYYDFHPYLTEAGRYKFCVRAIPKDSKELAYVTGSGWVYSDSQSVDADEVSPFINRSAATPGKEEMTPADTGWKKDKTGWWYRNTDGSCPTGGWAAIDGRWYLFDGDGYMLTGWQNKDGKRYFLSSNGDMKTGWMEENKNWYLFGSDGAMVTGWADVGGSRYYLESDGRMCTGWKLLDGKWYYFEPSGGAMMRNTSISGRYINGDGVWVQ